MTNENFFNPFGQIFSKLEQIDTRLQIISANLPKQKIELPKDPNEILFTADIAQIMGGIPLSTVRFYVKDQGLPAIKKGKSFRIKRCILEDWIENTFLKENHEDTESAHLKNNPIKPIIMGDFFKQKK